MLCTFLHSCSSFFSSHAVHFSPFMLCTFLHSFCVPFSVHAVNLSTFLLCTFFHSCCVLFSIPAVYFVRSYCIIFSPFLLCAFLHSCCVLFFIPAVFFSSFLLRTFPQQWHQLLLAGPGPLDAHCHAGGAGHWSSFLPRQSCLAVRWWVLQLCCCPHFPRLTSSVSWWWLLLYCTVRRAL